MQRGGATASMAELTDLGEGVAMDGWVADEQLNDTCVFRNPLQQSGEPEEPGGEYACLGPSNGSAFVDCTRSFR